MPNAAKTPCRQPGCRNLVDRPGYCDQHRREDRRREEYRRYHQSNPNHQENNRFYAGVRWRRVRTLHLQQETLCRHCRKNGKLTEATIVDHVISRSAGGDDYDDSNLQSLCVSCHNAKTKRGA